MKLPTRLLIVAGLAGAVVGLTILLQPGPWRVSAQEPKAATISLTPAPGGGKADHQMFGGTPDRNFVNLIDTGLSPEFPKDPDDEKLRVLGSRIKWKQPLG